MILLNWPNANLWADNANGDKDIFGEPKWEWDCSFKLDYDGGLITVSSRFYPSGANPGPKKWEGKMKILLLGEVITQKEFQCDTLDQLKQEVEDFQKHFVSIVKSKFKNLS